MPRTPIFLVVTVAMLAALGSAGHTAAQTAPPATYYGTAGAGDAIEARFDGTVCASAVAGADGFWQLTVSSSPCGVGDGGAIAFYRNGVDSGARETFRPGGVPANVAAGVPANVAAGVPVGGATGLPAPAPAPAGPGVFTGPVPPVGSAGLLVTAAETTPGALKAGLAAGGCRVQALAVLRHGTWLVYLEGAPAVVNAAFPAALPPTAAFFVRC